MTIDPVTRTQILTAVNLIVADQQTAIDAAVATQKAADDLVIARQQTAIDLLTQQLSDCTATLLLAQQAVADLTTKLAAAQVIEDQDAATIADLTSQLGAAEQTITEQAARIKELEDELGQQDPPAPKTKFGWFAGPFQFPNASPVETKTQMRARCVTAFGCQPPVERIFNEGDFTTIPAAGIPAIVSFTQDPVRVAAGDFDAQIRAFVTALDPATTYWLCLNHECDQTTRSYTPAQQVAGFQHFATVVRSVGKPNVKLTTILMSWTLSQGVDRWRDWYPGPEYVDALGWDAYWRPTLPHTAEDIYGLAYATTTAEGKDFLVCETSIGAQGAGGYLDKPRTQPVPEDVRTAFVADAIAWLNGKAAAVTYFETNKTDGNWLLEGHAALALYSTAALNSTT